VVTQDEVMAGGACFGDAHGSSARSFSTALGLYMPCDLSPVRCLAEFAKKLVVGCVQVLTKHIACAEDGTTTLAPLVVD
jgi:hypothetical protein